MDNYVFGRYVPGNSIVHFMNPSNKLILSFLFVLVAILANNFVSYLLLFGLTIISILFCKVHLSIILRGIRPLLLVIIFTVLIQLLFTKSGSILFQWGVFKITVEGVKLAGFIFLRFLLIILTSSVFTLTTSPLAISYAIEHILSPLEKIKVPVSTLGMMISIALRFIPTLMEETVTIIDAQKSRGMDFNSGGPIKQIKKFVLILVPLFITSFKHAEGLAIAMEARGYQSGVKRTRYHVYKWHKSDFIALCLYLIVSISVIFLRN